MTDIASSTDAGLRGKAVLITGATAGIGFAIAEKFVRCGATVAVSGRNAERGAVAVERLNAIGAGAFFLQGDAGDAHSAAATVAQAAQRMGGLDVLVSAGAQGTVSPMPFADMTAEQIQAAFTSRLFPRIYPVHAAIPLLRAGGGGAIVMITTDAARHSSPGETMIGAAGAAVILLNKTLANELSRWAIRVNTVALTLTSDTPTWDRIFSEQSFENRLFSKALQRFPAGRAPTAEEVSHAAVFLASPQASQITGQTLSVNGGLSYGGW